MMSCLVGLRVNEYKMSSAASGFGLRHSFALATDLAMSLRHRKVPAAKISVPLHEMIGRLILFVVVYIAGTSL